MPESATEGFFPSPDEDKLIEVGDTVWCQWEGPKLFFQSLLDSGASYPSLYGKDLEALGIDRAHYGAQSVISAMTSNGVVDRRIYELHVEIGGNQGTPIIDPNNPVNPRYPRYIGGLSPVTLMAGEQQADENGQVYNERLSGVMPFCAPYVSSTPSKNTILFGEDRNDVLGAHKMPPTRRWMVGLDQLPASRDSWQNFQDPLIRFSHRGGLLVDEDLAPGKSKLTVNVGQANEKSILTDPRGDFQNQPVVDPTVVPVQEQQAST